MLVLCITDARLPVVSKRMRRNTTRPAQDGRAASITCEALLQPYPPRMSGKEGADRLELVAAGGHESGTQTGVSQQVLTTHAWPVGQGFEASHTGSSEHDPVLVRSEHTLGPWTVSKQKHSGFSVLQLC